MIEYVVMFLIGIYFVAIFFTGSDRKTDPDFILALEYLLKERLEASKEIESGFEKLHEALKELIEEGKK